MKEGNIRNRKQIWYQYINSVATIQNHFRVILKQNKFTFTTFGTQESQTYGPSSLCLTQSGNSHLCLHFPQVPSLGLCVLNTFTFPFKDVGPNSKFMIAYFRIPNLISSIGMRVQDIGKCFGGPQLRIIDWLTRETHCKNIL